MALPGKQREQDLTTSLTPSVQIPQEEPQIVEEDSSFLETAGDVLIAPFRGIEGMLNGAYNLADMATFDVLPDWDTRFLGTSKTTAGSLVEGISQFASGFVPIFGAAGKIGALAKAGTVTRGVAAGAVTDFVAFKGQEDRLSNLIQQFPELQNPVTEFLAHDANESEVEGRLKNVLEGLILEGAIGGTVALFMKSLRALKAGKKVRDVDGGNADEVNKATSDSLEGGKALASIKAPRYIDEFRESIIDEWDYRLQEDALSDEVAEAIPDFPKPYRDFLKALEKEDWLGFDYPSQAVNAIITSPTVYKDFEISPALKSTVTKLENAFFKGDIAEPGLSKRSGIFAGRIDDKTKDFLLKGAQAEGLGQQAPTIGKTLDQLAVNADSLEVKNLAKNLKKIIKDEDDLNVAVNYKPDVEGDPTTVRGDVGDKGSIAGVYKPSTDRVELYGSADEQTLVHEMLHGVTAKKINSWVSQGGKERSTVLSNIDNVINNKAAPKPIRELAKSFKIASEKVGKEYEFKGADPFDPEGAKGIYGFKDLDEFLVAAFTDLELQRILRRISADDKRNIFQKIVDAVAALIGTIKGKEGSNLLDKVLRDSAQIISASRGSYMGKAKLVADEGLASVKRPSELPDFKPKIKTDPEWQQWTNAVLKGESPTLPRLEVVGDIDSAHKILTEKYSNNPELLKKFDEAPADFLDEDLTALFEMGAQSIKDRRKIRVESEIFKDLLKGSNERLMKAVKEFDDTESLQSEAALRNQLSEFVEIYDYYRQMGSEDSKNLAMRRQKKPISRKIGLEKSELQNTALVREFLNNQAGGMSPKKAVKLIKEMYDPNNPEATIRKVLGIAKKAQGKSLLDMTTEYWINSILSGPRTQAVNVLGNILTQVLGAAEMTAGAVLSGNMPLAKAALALSFDVKLYLEAFSAAGKTLITGREVLDVGSRTMESSRQAIGESIDFAPFGFGSKNIDRNAINTLGTVINLPARGLLTGDEFFKQVAFRRAARLKAGMEAINSGMSDSKEIAKYVEDKLNKVVTVGGQVMSEEALIREATKQADKLGLVGQKFAKKRAAHIKKYVDDNFDEDASNLAAYALEEAKYFTHTRELEEGTLGKGIQNLTKNFAFARFVLPFVRTPSNLLSFALERSPLGFPYRIPGTNKKLNVPGLRSEAEAMREGLKSSDPVIQAAARGKIVTAFAGAGLFYEMVFNNNNTLPLITGGGPKDEKQKKILQETGWRPYSIKIGDTYYDYKKLDPIATILGIVADMSEMMKENEEANEEGVEQVGIALATALSRNVANKSYLAGVQLWAEALQDPDRFGERLGRNYVSSFVPNVLSQMQDYDKQSMREVRDVADAILKKLPGGRDMLDPRRNILGEEKIIDYGTIGFMNPVATSKEKDDAILQEMADLQYAFRQPSPKISGGNVNLLDFVNNRGRTAYDRSLDLLQTVTVGGRTLRQTLKRLIKSSQYQRLPDYSAEVGVDSPRVQEINKVLKRFRKIAKREMLKEFPDVATQINNVNRALKLNRQGVNRQEVLELLSQTN